MILRTAALVAIAIALIVAACGGGQTSVDRYYEETGPLAESATLAAANWSDTADTFAEADVTSMTREEYVDSLERSMDGATQAYVAYRDAVAGFLVVVPPPECKEIHLATTEALSLAARGYLEIKGYIESVLMGQADESVRDRGNQLLADADLQKQHSRILIENSDCK